MTHYNAFISYNHNPRDIKIASMLQQQLERYHVPRNLSSAAGTIERVFLDKGELEVSGDLNEIIQEALQNSDYLIVICSPESRESIWVKREIEFFLQNHTLDHILTVITEGEPFDVLPEAVLHEEITDESGVTRTISREPLSCDYRLPLKEAKKQELPRLVAALLGCRYDDLIQRQRAYRKRRLTAIIASTAVILSSAIAYLVWSNHQIRVSYDNTLREESINYAKQSSEALSKGDRVGAIRFALDGLPSDEQDRPVVSDAVFALSKALNVYSTPADEKWSAVRQYQSGLNHVCITPFTCKNTDYLAELYYSGRVRIWNLDTDEEVMADYTGSLSDSDVRIDYILESEDHNLILMTSDRVICLDVAGGKEIYNEKAILPSAPNEAFYIHIYSKDVICSAKNKICVITDSIESLDSNSYILIIDTDSGKVTGEIPLRKKEVGHVSELVISDDASTLAVQFDINEDDDIEPEKHGVRLYDIASCKEKASFTRPHINDIMFDTGNRNDLRLMICGYSKAPEDLDDVSLFPEFHYIQGNSSLNYSEAKERTEYVACINASSGEEFWSTTYTKMFTGLPWLEYEYAKGEYKGDVYCVTGSDLLIITPDGEIKEALDFKTNIRSFFHGKNMVRVILRNGSLANYNPETGVLQTLNNIFTGPVYKAIPFDGKEARFFVTTSDNELELTDDYLLQYEYKGIDDKWQDYPSPDKEKDRSFKECETYEDHFIEIDELNGLSFGEESFEIIKRKMSDGSVVSTIELGKEQVGNISDFRYSFFDHESGTLYFENISSSDDSEILSVSVDSGEIRSIKFSYPEPDKGGYDYSHDYYDVISYLDTSKSRDLHDGKIYIPATRTTTRDDYDTMVEETTTTLVIISVDTSSGETEVMDISDLGDREIYASDIRLTFDAAMQRLVMVDRKNRLVCYGFDGRKVWSTDPLAYTPGALGITDRNMLLAIDPGVSADSGEETDSVLHVMDMKKGKEKHKSDLIHLDLSSYEPIRVKKLSDGNSLIELQYDTLMISEDEWNLLGSINSTYIAYNDETDEFILGSTLYNEIGHVPYRNLDELLQAGREIAK